MITRKTETYPATLTPWVLPKRNEAYKLWSVCFEFTASAAVLVRFPFLLITDGGGNAVAQFTGQNLQASASRTITFAQGVVDVASLIQAFVDEPHPPDGMMVSLADDLWIQPSWSVQVGISQTDPSDSTSVCTVAADSYVSAQKKVAPHPPTGEDT